MDQDRQRLSAESCQPEPQGHQQDRLDQDRPRTLRSMPRPARLSQETLGACAAEILNPIPGSQFGIPAGCGIHWPPGCRHEDRHLEHQRASGPSRLRFPLARLPPSRPGGPAGVEDARGSLPPCRVPGAGLPGGGSCVQGLERRFHPEPGTGRRASVGAAGAGARGHPAW